MKWKSSGSPARFSKIVASSIMSSVSSRGRHALWWISRWAQSFQSSSSQRDFLVAVLSSKSSEIEIFAAKIDFLNSLSLSNHKMKSKVFPFLSHCRHSNFVLCACVCGHKKQYLWSLWSSFHFSFSSTHFCCLFFIFIFYAKLSSSSTTF